MTITATLWTKHGCDLCDKARAVLDAEGINYEIRKGITPDEMVEFADADVDPLATPLLRMDVDGRGVRWWGPEQIKAGLLPLLRKEQARGWPWPEPKE